MAVRKWEGYTLLCLEVFIIFLNVIAIIVISRFKRKYNPDVLIFALAVADLMKALFPLNMTLVVYLSDKPMEQNSFKCKVFGWTAFTLNSGIMLVMTVMAIDRYLAMCWPFRYRQLFSKKRLICTIVGSFVFSGTFSVFPLVGFGRIQAYHNGSFCHFDFDSTIPVNRGYSIFVLSLGFSMLVVVVFCYTRAMLSARGLIKRQRRMSSRSRDMDKSEQKRHAMNRMFARLMIVMMIAFCISWLLFLIVVLDHVSSWFDVPSGVHFWSMRLAVFNSVLNPLIGAAMCKPYRKGYLFIFCKLLHCCGLCSSYQAKDPWTNQRKASVTSRNNNERELPPTPTSNLSDTLGQSQPLSCPNDSGIEPDCSIGYNQGGVINAAYGSGVNEAVDGEPKVRPGLQRKRISFKDEVEARSTQLKQTTHTVEAEINPSGTTSEVQQSRVFGPTGMQGRSCKQGDKKENMPSKTIMSIEVEILSHSYERSDACELPGPLDPSKSRSQEISAPVGTPKKSEELISGEDGASLPEEEKLTLGVKSTLDRPMTKDCQVTVDTEGASLGESPGNPKMIHAEVALWKSQNVACQIGDQDYENEQVLQITHFPVDGNSEVNTALFLNTYESGNPSVHMFSPPTENSDPLGRSDITSVPEAKPHDHSFFNDSQVTEKTMLLHLSGEAPEPEIFSNQLVYSTETRGTSNFNRTASLESGLRKKSKNSIYRSLDTSQGLSSENLKEAEAIPNYAESRLSHSTPEMLPQSSYGKPNTGDYGRVSVGERRCLLANKCPTSNRFRTLSELSQNELEREVFC
ncbi:uncharacterized protein [Montipora foliosa]|uniref:uncharacterized protein isoform X1 n=1 Tax=Montipora foliosa TaxID=591990 RepID=UPI0035F1CC4C